MGWGFGLCAVAALSVIGLAACAASPVEGSADVSLPQGAQPALMDSDEPLAPEAQATAIPLPSCDAATLPTVSAGGLTVAIPKDPDPPWRGSIGASAVAGLEPTIVVEAAAVLGFPMVSWVPPTDRADFSVDRFTADLLQTEVPGASASTGYFTVSDALVGRADWDWQVTPAIVADARIGYVANTDAELTVRERAWPSTQAFASEASGVEALGAQQIDLLVAPITRALELETSGEIEMVAQLAPTGARQPQQLVMAIPAGSGIGACLNAALDRLRVEGLLEAEANRWIDVPVLP